MTPKADRVFGLMLCIFYGGMLAATSLVYLFVEMGVHGGVMLVSFVVSGVIMFAGILPLVVAHGKLTEEEIHDYVWGKRDDQ